jgi:hypothetical protein
MLEADRFGVDAIERIEHYGRYTIRVPRPRRFVWEAYRERELDLPMIRWRIGDRWFTAVIPIESDRRGLMDQRKAEQSLRSLIEQSRHS